jgi:two-component system sensor histidine kinase KdpD
VAASSILDEEPVQHRELITVIEEEADRLDLLVNETIRMARIEAGDFHLRPEPQSVSTLIDSSLRKLRILMDEREVGIDVPEGLPDVLADPELASLALRQLLTNSVKYSNPDGPISIWAEVEEGFVRIHVKDSGPGIPPNELPRIFERYYRAAGTTQTPGTGMGLSIAREIARTHGGEIRVESIVQGGSDFSFTLPVSGNEYERR